MTDTFAGGTTPPMAEERNRREFVRRHVKAFAVGTAIATLTAGGVALASWLVGGTGTAYSKAGTLQALSTVDVSATISGDLYPGGSGAATVKVHNPNPIPLVVTAATGNGSITSSDNANCPGSNLTFTDQTGLSIDIPAGGDAQQVFANAAQLSANAPNACQGVTFMIPVSVQGSTP